MRPRSPLASARAAPLFGALALLGAAAPARAADPFEIQVYDGTANAPGVPGLELHLNRFASGRGTSDPPELPLRGQGHATLEPSLGLTPWWEIGGYLQTALREDGHLDYAGVKLRSKFVTPPDFHPHVRLGVNVELSLLPETYDRDRWGGEVRPIASWEGSGWLLAANPIVGLSFGADAWRAGPSFEPAVKVARDVLGVVAIGAEYYGDVGPVGDVRAAREQDHVLLGALDLVAFPGLEVNFGLGGGLTPASAGLIGKVILGVAFDRAAVAPPSAGRETARRWPGLARAR